MSVGIIQRDPATGAPIFESVNGLGKALSYVDIGPASGYLDDNRLTAGVPFHFFHAANAGGIDRTVSFNGARMSWSASAKNQSQRLYYGVGPANNPNYVSSHVPGTAGFRINDDSGNFIIDETFFAFHFTGKVDVQGQGTHTIYVDHAPNNAPLIALRSTYLVSVLAMSSVSATRIQITLITPTPHTYQVYKFGKIDPSMTGIAGSRWYSDGGVLMGDTSVPPLGFRSVNNLFAGGDWDTGYEKPASGLVAGRNYAVLLNSVGMRERKTGSLGQQTGARITIYSAGCRVVTGSTETCYISGMSYVDQGVGGTDSYDIRTDARFSIVDVTGL